MNLQGRDLSMQMHGEDVGLLQTELQKLGYNLPPQETGQNYFGDETRKAVREFQQKYNLQPTGVVDEETARLINEAVDALAFVVQGTVRLQDGTPFQGAIVRATDKDLRREEPLGESVTDAQGFYSITYTADQFSRAEKKSADLIVRAYMPSGDLLGESGIIFNARRQETVDLVVQRPQKVPLAESERLYGALSLWPDVGPPDLNDDDLDFLAHELADEPLETVITAQPVGIRHLFAMLAHAGRIARQTPGLPTEFFYGIGRQRSMSPALQLEAFFALDPPDLHESIQSAIAKGIVPAAKLGNVLDLLAHLDQVKLKQGVLAQYELLGRLAVADTDEQTNEIKPGAPLAGYTVRAADLDAYPEPRELGYDISNKRGLFTLIYTAAAKPPGAEEAPARRLHLQIEAPQGEEIYQTEIEIKADQQKVLDILVPADKLPQPPAHPLDELETTLDLEIPDALRSFLEGRNIRTLEEIRKEGGLRHLFRRLQQENENPPVDPDHPAVAMLDAHANLGILSSDIKVNQALIDKGFASLTEIANRPRAEFVSGVYDAEIGDGKRIGDFKAAQLHTMADAQARFLNNILAGLQAEFANGFPSSLPGITNPRLPDWFRRRCECRDCDAAVSPNAYLADLLDYVVTNVEQEERGVDAVRILPVDLDDLAHVFHQPFGDLPAACESAEDRVRQVRICVEVLRSFLEANRPDEDTLRSLEQREKQYRWAAYEALLGKIGTSSEELRLAHSAKEETRKALADRLGIDLRAERPDQLDELLLNPETISEQKLEELFGLVDTTRDPLSQGVKLGDVGARPQITRWNLSGVEWNRNTDRSGTIYVLLKRLSPSVYRVELYRDRARTEAYLVAAGERSTPRGPVELSEENQSGLSGFFEIDYQDLTDDIAIVAVPRFLSWRLEHLRTLWKEQDFPTDPFAEGLPPEVIEELRYWPYPRPTIDPDVIGPDDFRAPFVKLNPTDLDGPFDLWVKRRNWVDAQWRTFVALKPTVGPPDFEEAFRHMSEPIRYDSTEATPWSLSVDLERLSNDLASGEDPEATRERIRSDLKLTVESFSRLMEIRTKDKRWRRDDRNEQVTEEEWREVCSILVQAQKVSLFPIWRREEDEQELPDRLDHVLFGPKVFWISLREPREGDWPPFPERPENRPLIDPELIKPDELPEPTMGKRAIKLWETRRDRLLAIYQGLKAERERVGFMAMFMMALGPAPPVGDDWNAYLNSLVNGLRSTNEADRTDAERAVQDQLHMTVEDFTQVMNVKAKDDATDPSKKPTEDDWNKVYAILTSAQKIRTEYTAWIDAERDLAYWHLLKARLPKWRASAEARFAWQLALRNRSQNPNLDPDVMTAKHLRDPSSGLAYDLRNHRVAQINGWKEELQREPRTLAGFDAILINTLFDAATRNRIDRDELRDGVLSLEEERKKGNSIIQRLEQVGLTNAAFSRLLRLRTVLDSGADLLDSEWNEIYNILVQVRKRREFADWRGEEHRRTIILGPDHFKIPEPPPLTFPRPEPEPLPAWRATWRERRDWEDKLQARQEQIMAVTEGLEQAVRETEEATLPKLRDALILATDADGGTLEAKAKQLTGRFLIDCRADGCQMTTRTSQAIETLQGLLWALRTGQLQDAFSNWKLRAPHFDEDWKWIGSYAMWRAAMFVFMYPENILLPSFRREMEQTPAFKKLVQDLRNNRRLTPEAACEAAKEYSDYLRDIASLTVEATCLAHTRIHEGGGCHRRATPAERELFYMFGRGKHTNTVYWSAYDPADDSGYAQTFWERVPGLDHVVELIGAQPYYVPDGSYKPDGQNYVFLFAITGSDGERKLVFTQYNLVNDTKGWDDEPTDLELDELDDIADFSALLTQRMDAKQPRLAIRDKGTGTVYTQQLNADGTGWEDAEFREFRAVGSGGESVSDMELDIGLSPRLLALHQVEDRLLLLIYESIGPTFNEVHAALYKFDKRSIGGDEEEWAWYRQVGSRISSMVPTSIIGWIGSREWDGRFYAFWSADSGTYRSVLIPSDGRLNFTTGRTTFPMFNFRMALNSGPRTRYVSYARRGTWYLGRFTDGADLEQVIYVSRVVPKIRSDDHLAFDITDRLSEFELQSRRTTIERALADNSDGPPSNLTYLEEAYYFVPIHIALQLQRQGHYTEALDWFRTVYDYSQPPGRRIIYPKLEERDPALSYERAEEWLLDPLNPHAIAQTRPGTYLRFTLLSIIRCLLDYADAEFTRDTAESVPRARTLYSTALELLDTEALQQRLGACEAVIGSLEVEIGEEVEARVPELGGIWDEICRELWDRAEAVDLPALNGIANEIQSRLPVSDLSESRLISALEWLREGPKPPSPPRFAVVVSERPEKVGQAHDALISQLVVSSAMGRIGGAVGNDFRRAASTALGISPEILDTDRIEMPWLRLSFDEEGFDERFMVTELSRIYHTYVPTPLYHFCIPANPVLRGLHLQAELNLHKIRACRNIAGMERTLEPYAAPTDTVSGLPDVTGGRLVLPGTVTFTPTPYRYSVLIERAKQLVQLAAQVEAALLSALEKRDAEAYLLLKARQDVQLTRQGVRLQDLRLREAQDGVELAELQQERAQIQADQYQEWLDAGISALEFASLVFLQASRLLSIEAAAMAAIPNIIAGTASGSIVDWTGTISNLSQVASTQATILSTLASFERRAQGWEFQRNLAQHDIQIGAQQVRIAEDQVRVVGQERRIAEMQADHAQESVDFLTNKFTNVELYDWMSSVLEGVYSFFLQQATAMAKLAENQLAFERQEIPPAIIQADYWEVPSEGFAISTDGRGLDRRGLTGSARLLQDIYRLDQYAFEMDQRKLQLTKTISLARRDPYAFQRLRETGVIQFDTSMDLFDRDFPGHYLRLIKRVRTSVIALIPPTQGIHATLSTTGLSRAVVSQNGIFQTTLIRRPPESIALSSPSDATGLFELQPQAQEMLLPFEGMGVDTAWEFRMPKASNLFDYSTIADVLITIEYTALDSFDYRQQVIRELDNRISAERPFSFRQEFADQWYDLHNPEQTATPMVVRFRTRREDFPPNIEDLRIQHVVLYFARADEEAGEVDVEHLHFTEQGGVGPVGGRATSIDGVISTRRGNAGSWTPMIGKLPIGEWELALPNTEVIRNRFKEEKIEDILFVVTYRGRTPEWPN